MDRSSVYLRVAVFVLMYRAALFAFVPLLNWLGGYFTALMLGQLLSALAANWVPLRIYSGMRLADLGLRWNGRSLRNFGLGVAGGMGAAALVLATPLFANAAILTPAEGPSGGWQTILFTVAMLLAGSAGEEILFHGYGFQVLLGEWGPNTTVFTAGAIFGVVHGANPNSSWLALVNTAGFGILFGYAFLRTRDLFMPIGLHFGWNFTLPLFGVNVSGLTMKLTGHQMEWTIGSLLSGGEYGPEGGLLTTIVLAALALFIWRAPVRPQQSEVSHA